MGTKLKVITMNKIILILITASMFFTKGYAQQAEVLTLGVFHFEFPNLDVQQISEEDQNRCTISPISKGDRVDIQETGTIQTGCHCH